MDLNLEHLSDKLWTELMKMLDKFSIEELILIKSEVDIHEFIIDSLDDSIENKEQE